MNMSTIRCCSTWNLPIGGRTACAGASIRPSCSGSFRHAAGLGAQGDDGFIGDLLDQRQAAPSIADHGVRADRDIVEMDFRSAATIDRRVVARGDALASFGVDRNSDTPPLLRCARRPSVR